MNEFSIVCRVLGTLFYRQPQDPLLVPLFSLIQEGKLQQHWPLEQDELLQRLQQGCEPHLLAADFNALFVGAECSVSPLRSTYVEGATESEVRSFLQQRGMPLGEAPADHFGSLLLAASWLEDQSQEDEAQAQITLFDEYLLPWCGRFLGKVEAHATSGFYRTLAMITRDALQAMRDELAEYEEQEGSEDDEQA
ncbi:TorD/DmsD family molecular chaperone [Serratia rhizosphaerae]|uniref:TorD/DmsD family molecular chaperone n=1 Tax=unclassified Serratia (in: enterobacteria) TaxID=2647522 RepID=UPI000CF70A7D|nr:MULTISPECIES: molecular chaperone [unclassified Serratia (in: enterobacteria)]MBU3894758.1 molecular chaperone [Serratia rubidaea]AVJ18021.1 molecular chaperone [Serratia sp. MYb239]MCA4822541.1 molecular chaperone [Serratia rubidaea]QNK34443.1 molecular chaperone [Serratia sp. JUb9]QPT11655.1 molecular chaperone [Serratia rubidaea]